MLSRNSRCSSLKRKSMAVFPPGVTKTQPAKYNPAAEATQPTNHTGIIKASISLLLLQPICIVTRCCGILCDVGASQLIFGII